MFPFAHATVEARDDDDEAKAASLRAQFLQYVVEQEQLRKQRAAEESQRLRGFIERQQEYVQKVNQWALRGFEDGDRGRLPGYKNVSPLLQRWKKARELARNQFLNFPEKSNGAIASGRALNLFLDSCGEVALQHGTVNRQIERQIEGVQQRMRQAPDQSARESLRNELDALHRVQADVQKIGTGVTLTLSDYDRRHINCLLGETGTKLTVSLQNDPLPLEWPALLRVKPEFAPYLQRVELAKKLALADLDEGHPIGEAQMANLMESVDSLDWTFKTQYERFLGHLQKGATGGAGTLQRYTVAKKFVLGVRHGVARLVEAGESQDVRPGEFEGETIQELIDFMCRRGLRFAPAGINDQVTYRRVYTMLRAYYSDLYSLRLAAESEQRQLEHYRQRKERLDNIAMGNGIEMAGVLAINVDALASVIRAKP